MTQRSCVLVMGRVEGALALLAERTERLGHRVLCVESATEAAEIAARRKLAPRLAIVDANHDTHDWPKLLRELRTACGPAPMCIFAGGEAPEEKSRKSLRRAGIEIGLFHPLPDHALRFFLNRGSRSTEGHIPRGDKRIPTDWNARVFAGGREKLAQVYSFSPTGAYLATRQPSLSGSEIALELPLPVGGTVTVTARVVYTNVPGNLIRPDLPVGMAVRFTRTPSADQQKIRESVARGAAEFAI